MYRSGLGSPSHAFAVLALAASLFSSIALGQEDAAPASPEGTGMPSEATASETAPPAEASPDTIPVEAVTQAPAEKLDTKEQSEKLDTVEVTGSRLKRTDFESAQPVVVISREDIQRSGLTDISEILRNLTVAGNNSLSAQQGRFALTMGETNLDLRNLGATHTLLLVNGRRWITGLVPTQTSVSDFNTIPTAIIDRIEILKDGASATYGSDAIAGVVNVITRKNFDGGEFSYHVGQFYEERDGTNHQGSLSYGINRPDSNLFINLSYTGQEKAATEKRALTARPNAGPTRDSIVTPNGLIRMVNPTAANATQYGCQNLQAGIAGPVADGVVPGLGGTVAMTAAIPAGLVVCDLTLNPGAEGGARADYHSIDRSNPDDIYNRFADGSLKQPNQRIAFYTQFDQRLTDNLRVNLEGLYNSRESTSVGQNGGLSGGNFGEGAKGHLAHISATHPMNPFGQDIGLDSSCGVDPEGPTCTDLGPGSGVWNIRRADASQNNQEFGQAVDTIRAGIGLEGDFSLLSRDWNWDLGYIYGSSKIEELLSAVNYEKAGRALGNFGTCDGDCVPLNVFQGPAGLTDAAVNYIRSETYQRNRTRQDFAYLNFSTEFAMPGEVLPAPVAIAFGGEYRRDTYISDIDPIIREGLIRLNALSPTDGKTYAREAYIELGIPLVQDTLFADSLDLSLAARYSKFPRIDAVTTGKVGLRWQPAEDLLVRGTYSTGFRAPSVGELFLGSSQSFDPLLDPCADVGTNTTADMNCLQDGTPGGGSGGNVSTPYDLWQGNPLLQPERSRNLTYGLIYSPRWLTGLNLAVDFYKIEIEDYVVIGQGQFFLDSCYKTEERNYCEYIERNGAGDLLYVNTPYFNLTSVRTSGVDIGFDYTLPLPDFMGRVKFAVDTTYLSEFKDFSPRPGQEDEVNDSVGKAGGQFQGYPRWKATGYLTWTLDQFKASWTTRMAYHLTEPCGDLFPTPSLKDLGLCNRPDVLDDEGNEAPENRQPTVFYHNVQLAYSLARYNADISIGVNNVLDQDPPISRSFSSLFWYNYDPNHYDAPGRFGYVSLGVKF